MTSVTRPLTTEEHAHIDDVLRRLRAHYHDFPEYHDDELALIGFAEYEGWDDAECCKAILAEAEPFAIGKSLVTEDGFEWVMIQSADGWRYGVRHQAVANPIDIHSSPDAEVHAALERVREWTDA